MEEQRISLPLGVATILTDAAANLLKIYRLQMAAKQKLPLDTGLADAVQYALVELKRVTGLTHHDRTSSYRETK